MGEYVIFAIDNDDNVHINAKFLRYVDERQVMGKMKGKMKLCIGSYKGKLERSYIMRWDDFMEHIDESGYVDEQESILFLRDGYYGKVYATLKFNEEQGYSHIIGSKDLFLGEFKSIPANEAQYEEAWTYRPDLDTYYVCEEITEEVA
jgi:hypothetical protein